MRILNKNTIFFFSVSNNPSTRGSDFYNKLFLKQKKNYIYIPVQIKNNFYFKKFLNFLKNGIINVRGISVSMPLKSYAEKISDQKHNSVILSKNANTLIFKKKKIYSYNCDFLAAEEIFKKKKFDNFIIIGAGSLALSFINMLKGKKIFIFNRTKKKIEKIKKNYPNVLELNLNNSKQLKNSCIINASPQHNHTMLLKLVDFNEIKYICDCVIERGNKLNKLSKKYSIKYTDGNYFYKSQRNFQKKIYLNGKL